jgi:3-methyladenine DNA glycosylase/8-oxoguanine DNA glycosylase
VDELSPLDAFGTLIFQVAGQQLSVSATWAIVSRIEQRFGGHLPSPAELLAADPQAVRASGMSARKDKTLRALAERFVDGRLSDETLSRMTDAEVEAVLTEVPGIGPWTAGGFLLVGLDRPDVFLSGDLALRRSVRRVYGLDHTPTDRGAGRALRSLAAVSESCGELPSPRNTTCERDDARRARRLLFWTNTNELELNVARFDTDRRSEAVLDRLERDFRSGIEPGGVRYADAVH